jgi:signal transduction histidine kinase
MAEVARGVVELYEPLAEDAGVTITIDADPDLIIAGSRELLGQALANLLDNAIKYGAEGATDAPSTVAVTAAREGAMVLVSVADHGIGIPEADRDRVLERFVRLEASRSRPGFGLGLSLVLAVTRLHGGTLRLSDNHPGLKVMLCLPAKTVPA